MEELQEAIEDAQYMNAIMSDGAPRPTEAWKYPSDEDLDDWWALQTAKDADVGRLEGVLGHILGFWLFYQHCKRAGREAWMNFVMRVVKFKKLKARRSRKTHACRIYRDFLYGGGNLTEFEFHDTTLIRTASAYKNSLDDSTVQGLHQKYFTAEEQESNSLNVSPHLYDQISVKCDPLMILLSKKNEDAEISETVCLKISEDQAQTMDAIPNFNWDTTIFDDIEAVLLYELAKNEFTVFKSGESYKKFKQYLYLQHQPVKESDFTLFRVLGRGGFGLVNGCKRCTTGKLYAMKVMQKKRVKMQRAERLCLSEMKVLKMVESQFVVCLKYAFVSDQDLFLILDLMTGGDLAYHLSQSHCFNKETSSYFGARILLGIAALHSHNLVYRDLKPDNVLLDEEGYCKISDLGLATEVTPTLQGACGTRGYWAPEMLRRDAQGRKMTYDQRVDWFSFGALIYEFIVGVCPFRTEVAKQWGGNHPSKECMDKATLEMDPDFSDSRFDNVSKDFCGRLLHKNPDERLGTNGPEEIMAHEWFASTDWDAIKANTVRPPLKPRRDINAASQSEIGHFTEDRRTRKVELTQDDHNIYKGWEFTCPNSFQEEIVEFMKYEAEQGPIVPDRQESACCIII
mmetsp:Transcript_1378/g.1868  ORF Transcript_1378/g.1868 Transcript_1378/m.1868 type:complete len:627 (-) Transcript_1378:303-2183(-)|eukprot:CAMPEP_0117758060 /NCGR_PEP_ID=MMETSP0947-20121206/15142_1 /TAXON_ID=44440 /ORGANISM="Chattonella subsalsa, Strain CCMP2191" /LENGTH=626 /DNA_ID=CAMNT_0005578153 /DNA_START=234 /DNA_END=2114 /DNA_ORIENTATION=+